MRNTVQECELVTQGYLNRKAHMGVTDFLLTSTVAFSEFNAGGVGLGFVRFGALPDILTFKGKFSFDGDQANDKCGTFSTLTQTRLWMCRGNKKARVVL